MARPVNSLSDADTRLAELNTQILELEKERSALLRAELETAESRVNEIESFIGVYVASSPIGGAKAAKPRKAGKKKATGKRRGRPPGKKNAAKATKKSAGKRGPKKKAAKASKAAPTKRRARGNVADRVDGVKAAVKKAGKAGVSALQVSKDTNFPYASILKILNDGSNFKKVGEKRDRRYFLK